MGFFERNKKVISIFNVIAIVIIIVFNLMLLNELPLISMIESIVCIIALLVGGIYALKGYQKKSANLYKAFMIMFYISNLISLAAPIVLMLNNETVSFATTTIFTLINLIIIVCDCILAIGKNLEKNVSVNLSYVILVMNAVKLGVAFVIDSPIQTICICISNMFLACMLCLFVTVKYMDKESRGTK